MATEVTVTVPDGVYGGDEFTLEYEGTELSVMCPEGCGPGDAINLAIDVPASDSSVEVVVPDGCYPGMDFTVQIGDRSFNIAVPDGCEPGQAIVIQVPEEEPGASAADAGTSDTELARQLDANPGMWSCEACTFLNEPGSRTCDMCGSLKGGLDAEDPEQRRRQEQRDADLAKSLQGEEVRASANHQNVSSAGASDSGWAAPAGAGEAPASGWGGGQSGQQSLFSMAVGTNDGTFGDPAGDFHVGQLVQVTRSDGSWTYGKIMAYDDGGDTYSVMTRAGAKHFVERADLTDDVVVNPSDGSCAQQ